MSAVRPIASAAVAVLLLGAAPAPQSGTAILDAAKAEAARTHRAIFAIFHSSW